MSVHISAALCECPPPLNPFQYWKRFIGHQHPKVPAEYLSHSLWPRSEPKILLSQRQSPGWRGQAWQGQAPDHQHLVSTSSCSKLGDPVPQSRDSHLHQSTPVSPREMQICWPLEGNTVTLSAVHMNYLLEAVHGFHTSSLRSFEWHHIFANWDFRGYNKVQVPRENPCGLKMRVVMSNLIPGLRSCTATKRSQVLRT